MNPAGSTGPAKPPESKNRNLLVRLGTALVGIPLAFVVIWLGGLPFAVVVGVFGSVGAMELSTMALGRSPLRYVGAAAAFALPFFFLFPALGVGNIQWLWVGLATVTLTLRLFMKQPVETAGRDVSSVLLASIYGSLVAYLMPLRILGGPERSWAGGGWIVLVCALTWACDTGAYFAGRFFGRRKFFPSISPAKTWAGFYGGVVASVLGAFIAKGIALPALPVSDCVILGLIAGVTGPIGDLVESMLKRAYGVKDSGNFFPGHGGMLDRMDSLVFNALVVYGWCQLVVAGRPGGP
jgi:phosphatidate cytidylyltransferase